MCPTDARDTIFRLSKSIVLCYVMYACVHVYMYVYAYVCVCMFCISIHFRDRVYTQLSGPGMELAMMISFIMLRSALKLMGSQDFAENGFSCQKKKKFRAYLMADIKRKAKKKNFWVWNMPTAWKNMKNLEFSERSFTCKSKRILMDFYWNLVNI